MTTPPQPAQPQPSNTPPAQPQPSRTPWIIAGLLALAVGVGVACFFIGKSSVDTSGKESEAAARVRAEYQPGQPAYREIFDKGKAKGLREGQAQGQAAGEAQGRKVGLEQGTAQGKAEGDATGVKNGATAALGGFTSWDTNNLYVVTVDSGQGNVPFAITSRQPMQENMNYRLCANDPQNLCQVPVAGGG
jgi:hypothetical protein